MTKTEFLSHVKALYRCGNRSDSDSPDREDWTVPAMAGEACCSPLDHMLRAMVATGALSSDEFDDLYGEL